MATAIMPDQSAPRLALVHTAWTAEECAAYLRCSVRKLRDLPVPRRYVGRTPIYEPDRVKAWLAEGGETRPRRRATKGGRR